MPSWKDIADAAYCIMVERLERNVLTERQALLISCAISGAEPTPEQIPDFIERQAMLDAELAEKPKAETLQEKLMRELGFA